MDADIAVRILEHALGIGPRCGAVTLIAIDGRSGAGKTQLAEQVRTLAAARNLTTATIHTDELCPGWNGLPAIAGRLLRLINEMAERSHGTYPTWDWVEGVAGQDREVSPAQILIIEGVAAADPRWRHRTSTAVWVEAPAEVRKRRAIGRDGADFAPHWQHWADAENDYFENRSSMEADFTIDAT
jgi:uridine kinase